MSGFVLADGEGDTYDWRGARVVIKASGEATHGQLCVLEFHYPADLAVPTHVHDGEDEMFYLMEGELRGFCDDAPWTALPGSFVFVPRDRPHSLTVVGDQPARGIVVTGPAVLWRSVVANGTPVVRP